MDTAHLLSISVTPVVLISACGLISLALYNRLGIILARIRAFHQQKIEFLKEIDQRPNGDQQKMLEMLDSQVAKVTIKARVIQRGLYCLMSAVLAFLSCSLLTPATEFHVSMGMLAFGVYVLGVLLFIAGICWAIRELALSLIPLEEESACLDLLTAQHQAKSEGEKNLKLAKPA
jgi:hypothetical protein